MYRDRDCLRSDDDAGTARSKGNWRPRYRYALPPGRRVELAISTAPAESVVTGTLLSAVARTLSTASSPPSGLKLTGWEPITMLLLLDARLIGVPEMVITPAPGTRVAPETTTALPPATETGRMAPLNALSSADTATSALPGLVVMTGTGPTPMLLVPMTTVFPAETKLICCPETVIGAAPGTIICPPTAKLRGVLVGVATAVRPGLATIAGP